MRGLGSIPAGGNILLLDFMFSHIKASHANIGIIANEVYALANQDDPKKEYCWWQVICYYKTLTEQKSLLFQSFVSTGPLLSTGFRDRSSRVLTVAPPAGLTMTAIIRVSWTASVGHQVSVNFM